MHQEDLPFQDETYTLYGGMPPHVSGSATSRAAADHMRPFIGAAQRRVYEAILASGTDGLTDEQIEDALGGRHQGVSARRRELVQMNAVARPGAERLNRSGCYAKVNYALPKEGIRPLPPKPSWKKMATQMLHLLDAIADTDKIDDPLVYRTRVKAIVDQREQYHSWIEDPDAERPKRKRAAKQTEKGS